jgi:hypothetical protein
MVTGTHLNVTLHVHCKSCILFTASRKGIMFSNQFVGPIRTAYITRQRYSCPPTCSTVIYSVKCSGRTDSSDDPYRQFCWPVPTVLLTCTDSSVDQYRQFYWPVPTVLITCTDSSVDLYRQFCWPVPTVLLTCTDSSVDPYRQFCWPGATGMVTRRNSSDDQ